jgi:hypothetical protein
MPESRESASGRDPAGEGDRGGVGRGVRRAMTSDRAAEFEGQVARAERLMRGMGAGVETETGGDGRW